MLHGKPNTRVVVLQLIAQATAAAAAAQWLQSKCHSPPTTHAPTSSIKGFGFRAMTFELMVDGEGEVVNVQVCKTITWI